MAKSIVSEKLAGIGSGAVAEKTGRSWAEWLKVLDKAGCKKLGHKEIAALVRSEFGVSSWWSQMVTVGYEQGRGLREVHQKSTGYSASASRTVAAPLSALYKAWSDTRTRRRWLPSTDLTVKSATSEKSMRMAWADGGTVVVNFYAKGDAKSQVTIEHDKLASAAEVAAVKTFWADALGRLKALVET